MDYPKTFLKGIPNNTYFDEDGLIQSNLFQFNSSCVENENGFIEESINWHDDDEAIRILQNQMKGENIQFKRGVAILCSESLEKLTKKRLVTPSLDYERAVAPNNPFHGNILLKKNISNDKKYRIRASLVNDCFLDVIENPNITSI